MSAAVAKPTSLAWSATNPRRRGSGKIMEIVEHIRDGQEGPAWEEAQALAKAILETHIVALATAVLQGGRFALRRALDTFVSGPNPAERNLSVRVSYRRLSRIAADKWNALSAEALRLVRATNPTRGVVVEGVFWASAKNLRDTLAVPDGDPTSSAAFTCTSRFSSRTRAPSGW